MSPDLKQRRQITGRSPALVWRDSEARAWGAETALRRHMVLAELDLLLAGPFAELAARLRARFPDLPWQESESDLLGEPLRLQAQGTSLLLYEEPDAARPTAHLELEVHFGKDEPLDARRTRARAFLDWVAVEVVPTLAVAAVEWIERPV